jgi:hypothetical protein
MKIGGQIKIANDDVDFHAGTSDLFSSYIAFSGLHFQINEALMTLIYIADPSFVGSYFATLILI